MIDIVAIATIAMVAGFVGGWKYREYVANRQMAAIQQAVMDHMKEQAEENAKRTVEITVRREGDQFFVYNRETDEFLVQGNNHKDISNALNARFPNKVFVANREELKQVGYQHESL